jgi:hypothetical protein
VIAKAVGCSIREYLTEGEIERLIQAGVAAHRRRLAVF